MMFVLKNKLLIVKATFDTDEDNTGSIIDKNEDRSFDTEDEITSHRDDLESKDYTQRKGLFKDKDNIQDLSKIHN
jgi:hypothetical protein